MPGMALYLVRRIALSIGLLFLVTILTFIVVALIPGDPAVRILGTGATPAQYHALDVKLGLTRSIPVQYWHWLDHVFHGSLGTSLFTNQSVSSELHQRLGVTISLVVGATLLSLIGGVALGVASAVWRGPLGRFIDTVSWMGFAIPNFWLGLILVELFAVEINLFPPSGYDPIGQGVWPWVRSLILPVVTLAAVGVTGIAKQTRDSLGEVMGQEFVSALRMAGLSRRTILLRHALRNAAIPIVTTVGLFAVTMLGGTILVEQVFNMAGLGSLAVQAATDHDLPVIEGVVVYFTLIVVVINLVVDLSYAWLNPRVRVGT
jgi:peptide/nickel transport system permease protein